MAQQIVTAVIVAASAVWIGLRIWRWVHQRRNRTGGSCGGCSKCGDDLT
jgi:hypothetical protein